MMRIKRQHDIQDECDLVKLSATFFFSRKCFFLVKFQNFVFSLIWSFRRLNTSWIFHFIMLSGPLRETFSRWFVEQKSYGRRRRNQNKKFTFCNIFLFSILLFSFSSFLPFSCNRNTLIHFYSLMIPLRLNVALNSTLGETMAKSKCFIFSFIHNLSSFIATFHTLFSFPFLHLKLSSLKLNQIYPFHSSFSSCPFNNCNFLWSSGLLVVSFFLLFFPFVRFCWKQWKLSKKLSLNFAFLFPIFFVFFYQINFSICESRNNQQSFQS